MNFRYNLFQKTSKKIFRLLFPISKSSWTIGEVEDICTINLVPPEKLKFFFSDCIKMLQEVKGNEIGDYLEFGVFNGSSMSSMCSAAKDSGLSSMRFFGFDAFAGLPKGAENEDGGVWKKGFYACSFEKMQECLKRKGVNSDEINWVKGWYDKTLTNSTIRKNKLNKLGIVFIDCDTYSSSKKVLNFIEPLITAEVVLCFDDWKLNNLDVNEMGEYRAFNEFLEKNNHLEAREIKSYNRKSKSFLVRPIGTRNS